MIITYMKVSYLILKKIKNINDEINKYFNKSLWNIFSFLMSLIWKFKRYLNNLNIIIILIIL